MISAEQDVDKSRQSPSFTPTQQPSPAPDSSQVDLLAVCVPPLPSSSESSKHSGMESGESSPPSHSPSSCELTSSETADETSSQCTSSTSQSSETPSQRPTYKLVGDNIDKNVKPREMKIDHQTRSLHYFHTYAVRDRVNMSGYSDDIRPPNLSEIDVSELLPTNVNESTLRKNFAVIAGRTITKYMPFFSKLHKSLKKHIPHEFSHEMSQKSEVVSQVFV